MTKKSSTAVLAGHYSLFEENGILVPGIYQEVTSDQLKNSLKMNPYSSEFPLESFKFGIELRKILGENAQFISLVNDWQNIPKNAHGEHDNPWRIKYFSESSIPESYRHLLLAHGFDSPESEFARVPKSDRFYNNQIHFSESKMRNKFRTRFSATCSITHGCAQEFVPLLVSLSDMNFKDLVAIIPGTCTLPTLEAIRYVKDTLGLSIDIWSLYIYNSIDLDVFWNTAHLYKNGNLDYSL